MKQLEKQQWIIFGLAALIVTAFALLRFLPLIRHSAEIRHMRRVQAVDVARVRECAVQLPQLRRQVDDLKERTADYGRSIPKATQFAELWQEIADVMNRCSLTEQIVQPGKENIGRSVNSIPITIQCAGTLDQLFHFLGALRRFDRTVRIERCQLLNDADYSGRLKMNAVATIFYQNSEKSGN